MKLKETNTAIVSYEVSIDNERELESAKLIYNAKGKCTVVRGCNMCPFNDPTHFYECGSEAARYEIVKVLLGREE